MNQDLSVLHDEIKIFGMVWLSIQTARDSKLAYDIHSSASATAIIYGFMADIESVKFLVIHVSTVFLVLSELIPCVCGVSVCSLC